MLCYIEENNKYKTLQIHMWSVPVVSLHTRNSKFNLLKFRMLSRYRKLNGVMPLSAAEIEDNTIKLTSFIFFYLLLTP
jgi:hypothetical protein